jgi:ABC-type glycerol-3-phosphate transport system permease component
MASSEISGSSSYRSRGIIGRGFLYFVLLLGAGTMVLPFLWMLSTSVMTLGEATSGRLLPRAARVFCPHVNLSKTDKGGTVTDFAVGPKVREGEQELHTDSYYVAVSRDPETTGAPAGPDTGWRFQLVNNKAEPVAIVPVDEPRGALTDDWQPIPAGGGEVNTGRGLSFTFSPPEGYPADYDVGRRSGAARTDYVNCCEYPTSVLSRRLAERGEREYSGRPIPEDLSDCRTAGRKVGYFFFEFLGGNYYEAWITANFREYVWNSVRLTAITLAGILVVSTLAAYAFARMRFPGRNLLFVLLLSTMMIPETVVMIPNFLTITGNNPFLPFINWYDNWPALTIPFMAGFFNIFLLRQFFAQIPNELWDAARIDGAGHLRFLIRVVLPLSRAPIMTVIIFAFIGSWNALLWPLIATKAGSGWWPISVGLKNFVDEAGPDTNLWMAGASISMLPVLLIYFLAQRQFIEGIATTGLKG